MEYSWAERGPPTSLTAPAAARELVAAHVAVDGRKPTLAQAELELAHEWIETKRTEAMWRFNWGNLSAGGYVDGQERLRSGDVVRPPWFSPGEGASRRVLEVHQAMLEGRQPSAFRAYGSHQDGAQAFVRLLTTLGGGRIAKAAQRGDPVAYSRAVVDTGYCRDRDCQPDRMAPALARQVAAFRRDGVFRGLGLSRTSSSASSGIAAAALLALALSSERKSS